MNSASLLEQAVAQHRSGALQQAEPLYIAALAANPGDSKARAFWARLLVDQGRFAEALPECDAVLAADPRSVEAMMQKGFALQGLGRLADAAAHYGTILSINPNFPPALYLRGTVLFKLNRSDEALQSFDRALALQPRFPEAWLGRGATLNQMNRPQDAVASYDRALSIEPNYPEAWYNRGLALEDINLLEPAVDSYNRAIALRPNYANAHNNSAVALMGLRRFNEAARAYEQALALDPSQIFAFGGLAAAALYACDWDKVAALTPQLEAHITAAKSAVSPGAMLGYSDDPALLQRCTVQFTNRMMPARPQPMWRGDRFRNPRIRIAYLSNDFHEHATAHLIAELFERHDRASFEIWGVGFDADDGSALRRRLIAAFDRFVDARQMSDRQVAEMLHAARIDIAVDLKGHTLGARPAIFAQRPAPLQVNYLGFPGTMGADYYDYILGDAIVTPLAHQPWYHEAIVQLPDCYQPNDSRRMLEAPSPSRAEAGLPQQGFVFCCFNNNWKITAPLFAVWMRLLAQVPGSVLWLLQDNEEAARQSAPPGRGPWHCGGAGHFCAAYCGGAASGAPRFGRLVPRHFSLQCPHRRQRLLAHRRAARHVDGGQLRRPRRQQSAQGGRPAGTGNGQFRALRGYRAEPGARSGATCGDAPTAESQLAHHAVVRRRALLPRHRNRLSHHVAALAGRRTAHRFRGVTIMNSASLLEQAVAQHRSGAWQQAEPLYIAALVANPGDTKARAFWARLLVDQGRFAEALAECDRVLAADPRSAEALMQKGFALRGLDRLSDTVAHYDHILSINPNFPPALYLRGDALFALKRTDEALQSLDRALALNPRFPEAWLSRGAALNQMHRPREAIASYDRALAIEPNYPEAWYNRGLALEDINMLDAALDSYDRAIALRPDYAKAHNNRALTLMGLRRFNEAAAAYEQALALDPSQSFAFGGLAAAALHALRLEQG